MFYLNLLCKSRRNEGINQWNIIHFTVILFTWIIYNQKEQSD